MFGAEITLSSSTIANGLPTFSWVILPNLRAPALSKRKLTTGWLSWKRRLGIGQVLAAELDLALDHVVRGAAPSRSADSSSMSPGGTRP